MLPVFLCHKAFLWKVWWSFNFIFLISHIFFFLDAQRIFFPLKPNNLNKLCLGLIHSGSVFLVCGVFFLVAAPLFLIEKVILVFVLFPFFRNSYCWYIFSLPFFKEPFYLFLKFKVFSIFTFYFLKAPLYLFLFVFLLVWTSLVKLFFSLFFFLFFPWIFCLQFCFSDSDVCCSFMYHYHFLNTFSLFEILGRNFFDLFYGYTFLSVFIVCGDLFCFSFSYNLYGIWLFYFNVGHFYVELDFFNLYHKIEFRKDFLIFPRSFPPSQFGLDFLLLFLPTQFWFYTSSFFSLWGLF